MKLNLPDSGSETLPDGRRMTGSAQRNAGPILQALLHHAPKGRLLEIASGAGLHAATFAAALPDVIWQPTDINPENFPSISAWAATSSGHILPPVQLDATQPGWPTRFPAQDAVLLVNLLHLISTPQTTALLLALPQVLAPGGTAFLYGPFLRNGLPTSPGDATFDASIRAQNPALGYKDLDAILAQLGALGLSAQVQDMPANNLLLIARRA